MIGLAAAGAIAVGGWGLQAGALPSPTSADHVAARATFWLQKHRLVLDSFRVDRRTTTGACLRGWFSNGSGPRVRGSLFVQRGTVWLAAGLGRISLVRGRPLHAGRALLEATLGCSRELQVLLVEAVRDGVHLGAERSYVAGQAVVALRLPRLDTRLTLEVSRRTHQLHIPHLREERLTLYVAERTSRPLMAVAVLDGRQMSARLSLVSATPTMLVRVRLGRLAQRLGGG